MVRRIRRYWLALLVMAAVLFPCGIQAREAGILDGKTYRTYVPVRYVNEQLGYRVRWDGSNQTVNIAGDERTIVLAVGSDLMMVDGEERTIDAPPYVEKGTTYVPLRAIAEAMGLTLDLDHAASRLTIHQGERNVKLDIVSGERWKAITAEDPVNHRIETFTAGSRKFTVHVVSVDLLHPKVELGIGLARGEVGAVAGLDQIAEENGARVAMNGTFFDAYTESERKVPYGHIVKDGEMVHRAPGDNRTALAFDQANRVEMMSGQAFVERMAEGADIVGALQVGPRLLTDGQITVDPATEGFKDPKILENAGARSAVGVTSDHYLLLVTASGVTIPQLADIMKQAGAVQAMNMDGGASSGLYLDGKLLTRPGRDISNALLVFVRKE